MTSSIDYKVNADERLLFYIRLILSLGLYYLLIMLIVNSLLSFKRELMGVYFLYFYMGFFLVYLFFRFGVLIGHLKGNAVKLGSNQFPEIFEMVRTQSALLGLKTTPSVFILQSGGVLNAFATRFLGRNYIVLYSEIVETAMEQDSSILGFIIGHELGHIKRNHMLKNLILLPSYLIPFLGSAYSRACEYTCDGIGYALCPAGIRGGLLMLASGRTIHQRVNLKAYLSQDYSEDGFWKWFAEKVSSHPNLTKRLAVFHDLKSLANAPAPVPVMEKREEDHTRFMPQ